MGQHISKKVHHDLFQRESIVQYILRVRGTHEIFLGLLKYG
jgi:hypothetical protein